MINVQRILTVIDVEQSVDSQLAEALALAGAYGAELHLLHVVARNAIPQFGSQRRLQDAREKLEALDVNNARVNVVREIRQGTILECVTKLVQEASIDLLVVDPAGVGATSKRSFKSILNRLIDTLTIPVLAAPSKAESNVNLIRQASKILSGFGGEQLGGEHRATLQNIYSVVADKLSLSDRDTEQLLTQLEKLGILRWNSDVESEDSGLEPAEHETGKWSIQPVQDEERDKENEKLETTAAVSLLLRAIEADATDVHIDPTQPNGHVVHFRVDGRMQEFCRMQDHISSLTMKQLKLMANVSLGDPFTPTESRLELPKMLDGFEVRITTAPVADGEAIALRLVDYEKSQRPLAELGWSSDSFAAVYEMLHRRSGMVLVSGPTGAGKTTTAYSILNVLFAEQQNIISIEDPVELLVPFMRQINVDRRHNFTMKTALSTILRMDPDAVFIGEIRNSEGAQVALQAAACGKRAFSTIHMRDVSSTLSAMREFEIDPRSLADNLSGVITQRLVRRVCKRCCEYGEVTAHEREMFQTHGLSVPDQVARPRSCEYCRGTGYKGRIGVFEAVVVDDELKDAIREQKNESEIRSIIHGRGISLVRDGLQKVIDQVTSIQEVQEMSWLTESIPLERTDPAEEQAYERGMPFQPVEG